MTVRIWAHACGGGRIHGSHASDLYAHDMNNSVKKACIDTRLLLLVLEWGLICNFKKAPFESDENWHKFREEGLNIIACARALDFECDLWSTFDESISRQFGIWNLDDGRLYTIEHHEEFARCYD